MGTDFPECCLGAVCKSCVQWEVIINQPYRKYRSSVTKYGFRQGDWVNSPQGIDYVSDNTDKQISVSDANGQRLGQITSSKVTLIRHSTGLIIFS